MPDTATSPPPSSGGGRRALGTVTRAGRALDLFTPQRPVWGATGLARELGVAKSQAHELLVSLSEIGLLRREAGGRYRLGWRTLALGRDMLRSQFPDTALQALRQLAQRFQEPVVLMTFDRDRLTVVLRHGSSTSTDPLLPVGAMDRYVHCCAMAKCLVAARPDADRRAILTGTQRFTPATRVDLADQLVELDEVCTSRLAFDRGEIHPDLRAVASPVADGNGDTIAAVGLWTTTARWDRTGPEMTSAVATTGRHMAIAVRTAGRVSLPDAAGAAARQSAL